METSVNNKCVTFTSLEQSKKLAEILPFESADMYYPWDIDSGVFLNIPIVKDDSYYVQGSIDCWSLAALLGVLPNYQLQTQDDGIGILCSCNGKFNIVTADNALDACVAMIEKLHELNLL